MRDYGRCMLLKGLMIIPLLMISGCVSVDINRLLNPELEERIIEKASTWTFAKILVIDISGMIAADNGNSLFFSDNCTPDRIKAILNKAVMNPNIRAVILRIDTPGGEVTATDMIHHELLAFKKRTRLPMVAEIMGMACSGGYYIACAADKIYAHPTSITGSIGIIARFPNLAGLADKVGYREEIFTTGDFKAMGHPLREISAGEREIIQTGIDSLYDRFLQVIASGRPSYPEPGLIKPLADGRIYTAPQAVENKLIDGIAYFGDVIAIAKQAGRVYDAHVITYSSERKADSNIYSLSAIPRSPTINLINIDLDSLLPAQRPGFYYLWEPGLGAFAVK